MSKRHVGKMCVYCGTSPAETMDHVFAREFLPVNRRANLPKVPACKACNNVKSGHEHYLTSVLPFASNHQDALVVLSQMVEPRLNRNVKAKGSANHRGYRQELTLQNGILVPAMTLPFEGDRVGELFKFIIQGLLYHHFGGDPRSAKARRVGGFTKPSGRGDSPEDALWALRAPGSRATSAPAPWPMKGRTVWISRRRRSGSFSCSAASAPAAIPQGPEAMMRVVGGLTASPRVLRPCLMVAKAPILQKRLNSRGPAASPHAIAIARGCMRAPLVGQSFTALSDNSGIAVSDNWSWPDFNQIRPVHQRRVETFTNLGGALQSAWLPEFAE